MDAAKEGTGRYGLGDIGDRRVGMICRWNIVERQEYTRNDLRDEDEQKGRSKNVSESRTAWDRLIESFTNESINSSSPVKPAKVIDARGLVGSR